MKVPDSNRALRAALNLKGLGFDEHRQAVEQIAKTHPHTITFIALRDEETCAPYALRLGDEPIYRAVAGWWNVFAGKDFMTWAVRNHLQRTPKAQAGCLVCYFSAAGWPHVGVINSGGRVTSKWGTYPLYEHGLAEVSEEYGDCIRFFDRPSAEDALALFRAFAHEQGLSDDDIDDARHNWREERGRG